MISRIQKLQGVFVTISNSNTFHAIKFVIVNGKPIAITIGVFTVAAGGYYVSGKIKNTYESITGIPLKIKEQSHAVLESIKTTTTESADNLKRKGTEMKNKVVESFESAKQKSEEYRKTISESVDSTKEKSFEYVNQAKGSLENIKDESKASLEGWKQKIPAIYSPSRKAQANEDPDQVVINPPKKEDKSSEEKASEEKSSEKVSEKVSEKTTTLVRNFWDKFTAKKE